MNCAGYFKKRSSSLYTCKETVHLSWSQISTQKCLMKFFLSEIVCQKFGGENSDDDTHVNGKIVERRNDDSVQAGVKNENRSHY